MVYTLTDLIKNFLEVYGISVSMDFNLPDLFLPYLLIRNSEQEKQQQNKKKTESKKGKKKLLLRTEEKEKENKKNSIGMFLLEQKQLVNNIVTKSIKFLVLSAFLVL